MFYFKETNDIESGFEIMNINMKFIVNLFKKINFTLKRITKISNVFENWLNLTYEFTYEMI